jgi:hypothetical protein
MKIKFSPVFTCTDSSINTSTRCVLTIHQCDSIVFHFGSEYGSKDQTSKFRPYKNVWDARFENFTIYQNCYILHYATPDGISCELHIHEIFEGIFVLQLKILGSFKNSKTSCLTQAANRYISWRNR